MGCLGMNWEKRAGELFQYGFEVKYLPLARYLQTASKYISTERWCAAREEFRLARVFDRYLELRSAKATTLLQIPQQQYPSRLKTQHDAMLEEVSWMSTDFRCERNGNKNGASIGSWSSWCRSQEALRLVQYKAVSKAIPISIASEPFYRVKSIESLPQIVPIQKLILKKKLLKSQSIGMNLFNFVTLVTKLIIQQLAIL